MDGFDVRNMRADEFHDVDSRTANYLVIAGYAARVRGDDGPRDANRVERRQQSHNRRAEDVIREGRHGRSGQDHSARQPEKRSRH
jgi:hypothetical protein